MTSIRILISSMSCSASTSIPPRRFISSRQGCGRSFTPATRRAPICTTYENASHVNNAGWLPLTDKVLFVLTNAFLDNSRSINHLRQSLPFLYNIQASLVQSENCFATISHSQIEVVSKLPPEVAIDRHLAKIYDAACLKHLHVLFNTKGFHALERTGYPLARAARSSPWLSLIWLR